MTHPPIYVITGTPGAGKTSVAPDSRNRKSVERYIKLAAPPVAGVV
jgi:broad-specificity NMP kinase